MDQNLLPPPPSQKKASNKKVFLVGGVFIVVIASLIFGMVGFTRNKDDKGEPAINEHVACLPISDIENEKLLVQEDLQNGIDALTAYDFNSVSAYEQNVAEHIGNLADMTKDDPYISSMFRKSSDAMYSASINVPSSYIDVATINANTEYLTESKNYSGQALDALNASTLPAC